MTSSMSNTNPKLPPNSGIMRCKITINKSELLLAPREQKMYKQTHNLPTILQFL